MKFASLFVGLAVACAIAAGCTSSSSKEYKPAVKTSTSLEEAAQTVDKTNAQLDEVMLRLDTLAKHPGDMSKAFKDYSAAVSNLESTSQDVNAKVIAMQNQRDAYFAQWDKDVATIQNEAVRDRSEQRKAELQAQFKKVQADYQQLQKTLSPLMSDLRDIRTAVSINMTAGGIAAIQGTAKQAHGEADSVRQALTALSADFKKLGVAVATTMPSAAPAAKAPAAP